MTMIDKMVTILMKLGKKAPTKLMVRCGGCLYDVEGVEVADGVLQFEIDINSRSYIALNEDFDDGFDDDDGFEEDHSEAYQRYETAKQNKLLLGAVLADESNTTVVRFSR